MANSQEVHTARLIFPHQLFEDHLQENRSCMMVLIEDDLYFKQFKFHKQKLLLHRISMQRFADRLKNDGFTVEYIETNSEPSMEQLRSLLQVNHVTTISFYDVVDDWLVRRIKTLVDSLELDASRLETPAFLTSLGQIDEYFSSSPKRMQQFYEWQRKRLNILIDEHGKPVGGKWNYDEQNRKKLPAGVTPPRAYEAVIVDDITKNAISWVEEAFPDNPGISDSFQYVTTHDDARKRLNVFISDRLKRFGPYEDAIDSEEGELFHSALSMYINIGLLTPREVLDAALAVKDDMPLQSIEGFVRQIIGWREYMRATYVRYGRSMRTGNQLKYSNKLTSSWLDGTTGLAPVDDTIKKVLRTGYAHHIERLMILGNAMVLLRIDPDEAYNWFMELFIDAYDWVMVPNVYAMSQFAAGDLITTKPYISGSNYIIKMSNYKKGEWSEQWDALYWQYIGDHKPLFEANYRSSMMVKLYNRFDQTKKDTYKEISSKWLEAK